MIKVIIADDEKRFRQYMETVLDWNALGFEICGIAANGEQAMELLETQKPDIALLDINMPKMDGIELTEKLKKIAPDTYVVFITGYSEFEYARKAVQLGVSEYLLKPFSKEELGKVVLKLKENIMSRKAEEKQQQNQRKMLLEETLNKMIRLENTGFGEAEEYQEKLEQLGCDLDAPCFTVSVVELDKADGKDIISEDKGLWMFGIRNILEELSENEKKKQISFYNYEGHLISIWKGDTPELTKEIYAFLVSLCSLTKQLLGISITVGVGSAAGEFREIPDSYRKAFVSLQNKYVFGGGKVISYEEIFRQSQKADFYRLGLNEKLLIYLRKNDAQKVKETLQLVELEMISSHYSMDYANAAIMGILSICLSYIVEMKGDIGEILGKQFSPYQELRQKASLTESFQWLSQIFQETVTYFKKPRSKRAEQIIEEVETYIQEHYSDFQLTAEDISEAFFLDISYIRKVFSRHKDYTIQDYITSVRMNAAKEKMEQQIYSIAEIAEMCGYLDAGYFSKCFKKYYHISPRQYQRQLQNGEKQA